MDAPMQTLSSLCTHVMSMWLNRFYIYSCAAFGVGLWICIQFLRKAKKQNGDHLPKSNLSQILLDAPAGEQKNAQTDKVHVVGVKIFYGSQTGTAKRFALILAESVASLRLLTEVIDMKDYDPDDCLVDETTSKNVCVFLVATYADGKPPESAVWFCKWLEESASDFRISKQYLHGLRFAVFGLGHSLYADCYNTVGRNVDKWLWQLGASRILSYTRGDGNVVKSRHGSIEADFEAWKSKFLARLQALCQGERKACSGRCKKGECQVKGRRNLEVLGPEQKASEEEEEASGICLVVDLVVSICVSILSFGW